MRTPALILLLTAFVVVPASLEARQDPGEPEPPPPADAADTVQLVFEREVFTYPSHVRRNPFRPLTGVGDSGPRFEELSLLGVIVSADPGSSVALLGVAGAQTPGAGTQRLRVGQRLGNVRVLEIRPREIVVEVEEFGLRERVTMQLRRTAPEANPGDGSSVPEPQQEPGEPEPSDADEDPDPGEPGGGAGGNSSLDGGPDRAFDSGGSAEQPLDMNGKGEI